MRGIVLVSYPRGPRGGVWWGVELGGSAAQAAGCCDRARRQYLVSAPVVGWPTAHIGMARLRPGPVLDHWSGALVGPARLLGLFGGLASLFLIGVMLVEGYLCRWCAMLMANPHSWRFA